MFRGWEPERCGVLAAVSGFASSPGSSSLCPLPPHPPTPPPSTPRHPLCSYTPPGLGCVRYFQSAGGHHSGTHMPHTQAIFCRALSSLVLIGISSAQSCGRSCSIRSSEIYYKAGMQWLWLVTEEGRGGGAHICFLAMRVSGVA